MSCLWATTKDPTDLTGWVAFKRVRLSAGSPSASMHRNHNLATFDARAASRYRSVNGTDNTPGPGGRGLPDRDAASNNKLPERRAPHARTNVAPE